MTATPQPPAGNPSAGGVRPDIDHAGPSDFARCGTPRRMAARDQVNADQLHQRLTALGDETSVSHHPMCGAHPVLGDGPCACPNGTLAALIRALAAIHAPHSSASINSLSCTKHSPNSTTGRAWLALNREQAAACPDCVVTPITVCSGWGCCDYPCETVKAIAAELGLTGETAR